MMNYVCGFESEFWPFDAVTIHRQYDA